MDLAVEYGDIAETLLDYLDTDRTDQSDDVMTVPSSSYLDPDLWAREIEMVFKRLPLMLALSIELPNPGDYKAMDAVGLPVLITRDKDGKAHAMLNVCSHRAAPVVNDGWGNAARFSCIYHGWTYAGDGRLIGVADQAKFGSVQKGRLGLTQLPCEEKAGMIFVVLTPGAPIDLESHLGGMLADLEGLQLDKWHFYGTRDIFGANWKVAYDGYIEGYHFATAHPQTVLPRTYSNIAKYDAFGPHLRIAFPQTRISELRDIPRERWGAMENTGYDFTRTIFPNISIFLAPEIGQIAQLLPGPTPDKNRTILNYVAPHPPRDAAERERMDLGKKFFGDVTYEEDYLLGLKVQKGLESGATKEVRFGRNERGNQHFHRCLDYYLRGDLAAPLPKF